MDSTEGSLLVATPVIGSPPFARAVILMLEHDATGAIGVILNAPTDLDVADHLPQVVPLVSEPPKVFFGGPVASESAILLGQSGSADFLRPAALGDIGVVDIDDLPPDLSHLRIFAGYAGWSPNQLEAELEEGSWWVLPANRAMCFAPDTSRMWELVVGAAPGTIAFHKTYPFDITAN